MLSDDGAIVETCVMPKTTGARGRGMNENIVDARAFSEIIGRYPEARVIAIERPAGSQDVNAVQSMADSFATCRTVIVCRGREIYTVNAFTWQREYWPSPPRAKAGEPKLPKFDTKAAAYKAASSIWPDQSFLATARSSVPHDGIVDACLIAEHVRRIQIKAQPTFSQ